MACHLQLDKAIKLCEDYIQDMCKKKGISFDEASKAAKIAGRHEQLSGTGRIINDYMMLNFVEYSQTKAFVKDQTGDAILDCLRRGDVMRMIGNNNEKEVCEINCKLNPKHK